MATHSSVLAWRIPGTESWWAAVYGVAQSRTRLKRLSSSSSGCRSLNNVWFFWFQGFLYSSFFFFFWCYIAVNSVFLISSHLLEIMQNSCKWLDIKCGICFKVTVKKIHNNFYSTIILHRLPWWLSGKESTHQFRRLRFNPWVRKIPQWRTQQPTSVFLPGKSQGRVASRATVHGVAKSWRWLNN